MPYDVDIGDGADALGQNQLTDALDGTYWVSGWDATLGAGSLEVDIAAGSGAVDGTDVSTGSTQTIDFTGDPDATDPRKAVISVDDTGTVQKTLGTAVPAAPTDEVRFRTYDPQPPTNAPGVVVAEVWLAAGATSLVGDDVRDRRIPNQAAVSSQANVPNWEEDANSPFEITGDNAPTISIEQGFDEYEVRLFVTDTGTSDSLSFQINGISTSEYNFLTIDGSSVTNNLVPFGFISGDTFGRLSIYNNADAISFNVDQPASSKVNTTDWASYGDSGTVDASGLSSIRLISNSNMDWVIEVYHRNVK